MDLSTQLLHLKLKNPTILASGILGTSGLYFSTLEQCGVGAVTTKSISLNPREGYNNPVMITDEHYMLNAVGLTNPGIDEGIAIIKQAKQHCTIPVIGSIFSLEGIKPFGETAQRISEVHPDMIEVDVSCPHVKYGKPIASDPLLVTQVVAAVKNNTKIPVSIKLSPQAPNIQEVARAAQDAGADAITAINTAAPALRINLETHTPMLSNKTGGLSGPALLPLALGCVYKIYEVVDIPIIGTGGITTGNDALEMLMAGATAVGIGTGVYYRGNTLFSTICAEMKDWMKKNGYSSVRELIGCAHE